MDSDELNRALQLVRAKLWAEVYAASARNSFSVIQCEEMADKAVWAFEQRRKNGIIRGEH